MRLDYCTELDHDIVCVDTGYGRKRLCAVYLVRAGDRVAFIDTGTYHSVPRFLGALDYYGIPRANVDYVIPTHAHLDHAGGAGELMRQLPDARLVAHPRAARHLIDPDRLIAGTSAVYGEEGFHKRFGEVVPVPSERLVEAPDGFALDLNGRSLEFIDSPGHARHHFCIHDRQSRGFFCGDTFGISYREFDTDKGAFIFATTTPPQFDPDAWFRTLARLLKYDPQRMYITHFGCVENVPLLADQLRHSIQAFADIGARAAADGEERGARIRQRMRDQLLLGLTEHGCTLSTPERERLLAMDVELNAQGLEAWLDRRSKENSQAQDS
ncbi:MAG: MBL fold metallo-hydrolase [Acidiferrobacterales bacterium]